MTGQLCLCFINFILDTISKKIIIQTYLVCAQSNNGLGEEKVSFLRCGYMKLRQQLDRAGEFDPAARCAA